MSHNKFWFLSMRPKQEDTTGVWLQLWCARGDHHLGNGSGDFSDLWMATDAISIALKEKNTKARAVLPEAVKMIRNLSFKNLNKWWLGYMLFTFHTLHVHHFERNEANEFLENILYGLENRNLLFKGKMWF